MCRVLILDDDADILELCSIILQARGYTTITETTCRDVTDKVTRANPDVILIDNWIPDIGGIEATKLIKNTGHTRHIPVIFFSASNNVEAYSREANADFFLQKPFDISELETVIETAMKKKEMQ
jgi:CheY-like chemotaxis protein